MVNLRPRPPVALRSLVVLGTLEGIWLATWLFAGPRCDGGCHGPALFLLHSLALVALGLLGLFGSAEGGSSPLGRPLKVLLVLYVASVGYTLLPLAVLVVVVLLIVRSLGRGLRFQPSGVWLSLWRAGLLVASVLMTALAVAALAWIARDPVVSVVWAFLTFSLAAAAYLTRMSWPDRRVSHHTLA